LRVGNSGKTQLASERLIERFYGSVALSTAQVDHFTAQQAQLSL